jgi:PadR family transcriptional regulator PadR
LHEPLFLDTIDALQKHGRKDILAVGGRYGLGLKEFTPACVLAVLERRDVYGYELTVNIKSIIEISESTLYLVLRRLQKDGYVVTYDQPDNGRNRRYYSITESGREKLLASRQDWQVYKINVDRMIDTM